MKDVEIKLKLYSENVEFSQKRINELMESIHQLYYTNCFVEMCFELNSPNNSKQNDSLFMMQNVDSI